MDTPSKYLNKLIKELSKLPGIGLKSASRVAFHILKMSDEDAAFLTDTIIEVKSKITRCDICGGISDSSICSICSSSIRNKSLLCVVENQKDVLTIEKSNSFDGIYHVLDGVISPLDGIGPDDINIPFLIERCKSENIKEVILATNPTVEGDATSLYISSKLKVMGIKIMRIARGLPIGADIDFVDSATIAKSFKDRVQF